MPISTEDKVFAQRLEATIEFKTKRAKRLAKIARIVEDVDAWDALKEELEVGAKTCDANIQATLRAEPPADFNPAAEYAKLRALAASADVYRGQIVNIEHAGDKIASLNEQLADHKQKLRDVTGQKESKIQHGRNIA